MSFSSFHTPAPSRNNGIPNPNNDVIISDPPTDSIQSLEWTPSNSNLLATGSWDCFVRCYSINSSSGESSKICEYKNDGAVLDVSWSGSGSNIISCGCDKLIKIYNPSESSPSIVGYHEKPIKQIKYSSTNNYIISGGWDKLLKYWDERQTISYEPGTTHNSSSMSSIYKNKLKPVGIVNLSERVYAMDLNHPLLCIAMANKKVAVYDVRNPQKALFETVTLLKRQLRCISCFNDKKGFAVGSVEGRTAIHFIDEHSNNNSPSSSSTSSSSHPSNKKKNFAFKCHRRKENVYAINSIKFHKQCGTFATAGSDGGFYFWDKNKKQKLKEFKPMNLPITDIDFNYDGTLFAYSISYDWSKGIEHFNPNKQKPQIFIHKVEPTEIMPKDK